VQVAAKQSPPLCVIESEATLVHHNLHQTGKTEAPTDLPPGLFLVSALYFKVPKTSPLYGT
jgi:hypothetical protein